MLFLADVVQVNTGAVAIVCSIFGASWVLVKFGDRLWKSEAPKENVSLPVRQTQSLECQYDHESLNKAIEVLVRSNEHLSEAIKQVMLDTNAIRRDVGEMRDRS